MVRSSYWGNRMINKSDLITAVPKHLRKKAKQSIENLLKKGFFNKKPGTKSEFRYSLSLKRKYEIDKLMFNYYTLNE